MIIMIITQIMIITNIMMIIKITIMIMIVIMIMIMIVIMMMIMIGMMIMILIRMMKLNIQIIMVVIVKAKTIITIIRIKTVIRIVRIKRITIIMMMMMKRMDTGSRIDEHVNSNSRKLQINLQRLSQWGKGQQNKKEEIDAAFAVDRKMNPC